MIRQGRNVVSAALFGILCGGALAKAAQPVQKEPDQRAFDQIGEQVYQEKAAPGFTLLVWSHGKVVFAKGYGLADVVSKTPVTAETRFAIGSITKQFTAASILLLAQQGKLSLDDKLSKYLPEMPNADKITLRMLLNQDSGPHNYPNTREHDWPIQGAIPPEKIIAILKTDQPDFAPGEKWEYSNTNYAVLAYIVSRVSGMPYADFLARNIFTPLGMLASGSGFAAQAGAATPYEGSAGRFHPAEPRISLDLFYGAGSVVSTAQDLARWDAALITKKLLNDDSMHALWTNGTLPNGQRMHYAMGFIVDAIGEHREIWHNGYSPKAGGYCLNAIFPEDDLAVIVLSNSPDSPFRPQPEKIVKSVLGLYDPRVGEQKEAAAASPAQDDPAVHALTVKMWDQMSSGKPDRSLLSPEMNAAMTPELLASAALQLQSLGRLENLSLIAKTAINGGTSYAYAARFSSGPHKINLFMTADGKVGGYRVLP
ncbi:MAG: serine hydrolase domain-containing protein [Silvibacterium sp.]